MLFRIARFCIVALTAFLISFILGVINGTKIGFASLRALFFAALFFVLSAFFFIIYKKFLDKEEEEEFGDFSDGLMPATDEVDGAINDNKTAGVYSAGEEFSAGLNTDNAAGSEAQYADSGVQNPKTEVQTNAGDFLLNPLEQNAGLEYNKAGLVSSAAENIDFNAADFAPGLPGLKAAPEQEEVVSLGNVELSVGKKPEKNIDLSDLGPNVDGKKVAQAIQTMLKKDDS